MESVFTLLGQVLEAILSILPRLTIVRATHNAVKWRRGKKSIAVPPGLTIYWPLITDIDWLVVARQTLNLPSQVLMTKDKHQVVAGAFIVYSIKDIIQAIGERNWDVDSTISDITQAAVVEVITSMTLDDILTGISGGKDSDFNQTLTKTCAIQLRQFGVHVMRAGLTDFSTCRVYKLIGEGTPIGLNKNS